MLQRGAISILRLQSNAAQVKALTRPAMAAATSLVCAGIASGWSRKRHRGCAV
jgi:hypothetical protein